MERAALLATLQPQEAEAVVRDWSLWARPEQRAPPGDWSVWLVLSGRGWGKTRTGAEWTRELVESRSRHRIALVARTAADTRDVMVEGASGILAVSPSWNRPVYEPSKRRVVWPNGAQATLFSADEPDLMRGPEHTAAWCDELATWRFAQESWDNLRFGLRIGERPQVLVTTTPRPIRILRELLQSPGTVVVRGSTFDNAVNLAPSALAELRNRYEGTRVGRQELQGELLDDVPGALWQRDVIDKLRVRTAPELARIVVAIDPAVTSGEDSDETGIVAAGKGECRCKGKPETHYFVLADRSCRASPDTWARRAVSLFDELKGDTIVGETNNGGDLVGLTIRTVRESLPFKAVHASRGKRVRAEPIAALYESGRVHHVGGFPELEDQMCTWTPDAGLASPDRFDGLVWSLSELSGAMPGDGVFQWIREEAERVTGGNGAPSSSATPAPPPPPSSETGLEARWQAGAQGLVGTLGRQ